MISDLLTNPENRGNADIDAAPIRQKVAVKGIVLYKPPNSDALEVPVLKSTATTLINSSAFGIKCAHINKKATSTQSRKISKSKEEAKNEINIQTTSISKDKSKKKNDQHEKVDNKF